MPSMSEDDDFRVDQWLQPSPRVKYRSNSHSGTRLDPIVISDYHYIKVEQVVFRFMDLPAEIRNNIYRIAVKADTPLRLRHMAPPAICCVSKQLRLESLPVYFDINTFIVTVRAPYSRSMRGFIAPEDRRYKRTGTLQLCRRDLKLIRACGKSTVRIKNLDIAVLSRYGSYTKKRYPQDGVVSLRMPHHSRKPTVSSLARNRYGDELEDLRHIIAPAKAFLEAKIAERGFSGLCLRDLKQLAKTLRVLPRNGTSLPVLG